jgi:quercetin dioxygenase-like cupin family protein
MNELAPVANQCWAVAASDDFRLAGTIRALLTIGHGGARVELTADEPGDPLLAECLTRVLEAYPWAAPLDGQTIELPFRFTAPTMQNLIDRRMVAHHAQAGLDVAVLLDAKNSGNPAVGLIDVRAEATRGVGPRRPDRDELWVLTAPATVVIGKVRTPLVAGDVVVVPRGASLELVASGGAAIAATVALVPGDALGVARAGALPELLPSQVPAKPPVARVVAAASAKRYPRTGGATTLLIEQGPASLGVLEADAGAVVPPHVHAKETEVLYLLAGGGTMTIAGVAIAVEPTAVIQIPAGVEHSFTATAATRALQLYSPPGPEQRFKSMK